MGRDPNWVAKGWLRVAKGRLVAKEKSGKCLGISGEIPRIRKKSGKLGGNQENFRKFRGKQGNFSENFREIHRIWEKSENSVKNNSSQDGWMYDGYIVAGYSVAG